MCAGPTREPLRFPPSGCNSSFAAHSDKLGKMVFQLVVNRKVKLLGTGAPDSLEGCQLASSKSRLDPCELSSQRPCSLGAHMYSKVPDLQNLKDQALTLSPTREL